MLPNKRTREENFIQWLVLAYAVIMLLVAFFADGTGDEGDSIMHYLFAKTAAKYPAHFFDNWAKPVYGLLAFPFSQMGFIGVKIMNVILSSVSVFLVYKISKKIKLTPAWLPSVFLVSMKIRKPVLQIPM